MLDRPTIRVGPASADRFRSGRRAGSAQIKRLRAELLARIAWTDAFAAGWVPGCDEAVHYCKSRRGQRNPAVTRAPAELHRGGSVSHRLTVLRHDNDGARKAATIERIRLRKIYGYGSNDRLRGNAMC